MRYIVLDMEWNQPMHSKFAIKTPVNLRGEIIQIGAVKLDENFRMLDVFDLMVCPKYYKKMNSKVEELTMISNQDLKKGISFTRAFEKFSKWCGKDFCILTWGWDDIPMLEDNLVINNIDKNWIPKTYNIQPIFDAQITNQGRQCALSTAVKIVGEQFLEAHNALNDALGAACVCKHLDMEYGIRNYSELKRRFVPDAYISPCEYKNCREIKNDVNFTTFKCSSCKNDVKCYGWLTQKRDKYIALGKCSCNKEYLVKFRMRKNENSTYRASRVIYTMDQAKMDYYNKISEEKKKEKMKQSENAGVKEKLSIN